MNRFEIRESSLFSMPFHGNRSRTSTQFLQNTRIIFMMPWAWDVTFAAGVYFREGEGLIFLKIKGIRRKLWLFIWVLRLIKVEVSWCLLRFYLLNRADSVFVFLLPVSLSPNSRSFQLLVNLVVVDVSFTLRISQTMHHSILNKTTKFRILSIRTVSLLKSAEERLQFVSIRRWYIFLFSILNHHSTHSQFWSLKELIFLWMVSGCEWWRLFPMIMTNFARWKIFGDFGMIIGEMVLFV